MTVFQEGTFYEKLLKKETATAMNKIQNKRKVN